MKSIAPGPSEPLRFGQVQRARNSLAAIALAMCMSWPSVIVAQDMRDSAGVRIVHYGRSARPRAQWSLTLRPILEISGGDNPLTEFNDVRGVAVLSDGRVAVANGGSNEIRVFGRSGSLQVTLGRAGNGPREFTRLLRLIRWGDTLGGIDGDGRAQVFDPSGAFVRSLRQVRSAAIEGPLRIGPATAGSTYVVATEVVRPQQRHGGNIRRLLAKSDALGDSIVPLVSFLGALSAGSELHSPRLLLDAEGLAVAWGERSCTAFSAHLAITCYESNGRPRLRLTRETTSREISEEDRSRVRRAYLAANADAPPAIRAQMERAALEFRFASRAPSMGRLVLGTSGDLWVGPFDAGVGLPGPVALSAPTTMQTWSIFGTTGEWVADLLLPRRFIAYEVGRDYVAGVTVDDDDLERVTVWGIRR